MKHRVLSLLLAVAILTAFTACAAPPNSTAAAPRSAAFQMRLVLDAPASDATAMSVVPKAGDASRKEVLYVQNAVVVDQTALKSARVEKDSMGRPQIGLTFTEAGRQRFAEVTGQNIGRRLAIVIDGRLYSAPRIMAAISGGRANISGNFSDQEAKDLVAKINGSVKP